MEAINQVNVRGMPVDIRRIEVEDHTDHAKITLWRQFADDPKVVTGAYRNFSNLGINVYRNEISFNSTQRTAITVRYRYVCVYMYILKLNVLILENTCL